MVLISNHVDELNRIECKLCNEEAMEGVQNISQCSRQEVRLGIYVLVYLMLPRIYRHSK